MSITTFWIKMYIKSVVFPRILLNFISKFKGSIVKINNSSKK